MSREGAKSLLEGPLARKPLKSSGGMLEPVFTTVERRLAGFFPLYFADFPCNPSGLQGKSPCLTRKILVHPASPGYEYRFLFPGDPGWIAGGGAVESQVRAADDEAAVQLPLLRDAEIGPQVRISVNGPHGEAAVESPQT